VTTRVDCGGTAVAVVLGGAAVVPAGGAVPGMHWEYPERSVLGFNEGLSSFRTFTKKTSAVEINGFKKYASYFENVHTYPLTQVVRPVQPFPPPISISFAISDLLKNSHIDPKPSAARSPRARMPLQQQQIEDAYSQYTCERSQLAKKISDQVEDSRR